MWPNTKLLKMVGQKRKEVVMATFVVTGDQKDRISNKLAEVQRQVFLQKEYGHDPELLIEHLQAATEGRFIQFRSSLFQTTDTDLDWWLEKDKAFAKKHLGADIDFRECFSIPTELPYRSVIPIFDPGNLTNRDMVTKALKSQGLDVYEEVNVMKYAGSVANKKPTLHLIENSVRPEAWTLTNPGTSPDQLLKTDKLFVRLRGYGLAMALYYFAKKDYLDPETWTWFPSDCLADGHVASGGWDPGSGQVRFDCFNPGHRYSFGGARVAISCGSLIA